MKKLLIVFTLIGGLSLAAQAQRFAYVDTEYILNKLPAYSSAQDSIDVIADGWKDEIATLRTALEQKKTNYQKNELLLTEQQRVAKQDEIDAAEREIRALQNKRFGVRGDLYKRRQGMIKPLQDKIYNAIKKMAEKRDFDFVLDKSTGVSILYVKSKFDMSDEVLRIVEGME